MASLSQDPVSKTWRIHFRMGGQQFQKSLKTTDAKVAEGKKGRIELTLSDIEMGRMVIPSDADPWEFIQSDGKRTQKPTASRVFTLADLFTAYFDQQTPGAKEANTLRVEGIHRDHILEVIGESKSLGAISAADIQGYVNARAKMRWREKPIRTQTIKKEVNTLQMVWNRAERLIGMALPTSLFADLSFPKGKEKPPFQTWQEIAKTIAKGRLGKEEQRELWDCLFLDRDQVEEVLDFVRDRKTRSVYLYPLVVFAAHTGARLSEIVRSRVEDLKFDSRSVVIREKKKSSATETYRRVPMSTRFAEVMEGYFKTGHPGGGWAISREKDQSMLDSTLHEAHEWHFRDSKWAVLRGYHVFRHSFARNLAHLGIDQRVIDELMGHQTDAMRKRYRHLFPEQRENAIRMLFDERKTRTATEKQGGAEEAVM